MQYSNIFFIFNQYTRPYLAGMKFISTSYEYILHTSGTALKILGYKFIELNESVFIILPWLVLSYSFLSVLRYQLYTVFLRLWKYYSNSDTVKQVEYFKRTLYRIMVLNYELYSIIGTRVNVWNNSDFYGGHSPPQEPLRGAVPPTRGLTSGFFISTNMRILAQACMEAQP